MSIPADQLLIAEVGLAAFAGRVPERVRDKVQQRYRREGQSFIMYEWRRRLRTPDDWYESEIAKLTYVQSRRVWKVFWMDSHFRWRRYHNLPESPDLSEIFEEIEEDPLCCFWG